MVWTETTMTTTCRKKTRTIWKRTTNVFLCMFNSFTPIQSQIASRTQTQWKPQQENSHICH